MHVQNQSIDSNSIKKTNYKNAICVRKFIKPSMINSFKKTNCMKWEKFKNDQK